jgi:hypothetical protein
MKRSYLIIGSLVIVAACSFGFLFINHTPEDILDKSEYLKWIENEDNGFKNVITEGPLVYEVTYCPIDYMIAREFRTPQINRKQFLKRSEELRGLNYFKLRMKRKNSNNEILAYNLSGGQQEYYKRVDYLSYGLEEDIFLLQNDFSDTLKPALFHFERTYGVAPYIDFLVAFKADSSNKYEHKVFVLDDKVFGSGVMRFDFNTNTIKNSPKLLVK